MCFDQPLSSSSSHATFPLFLYYHFSFPKSCALFIKPSGSLDAAERAEVQACPPEHVQHLRDHIPKEN